MKAAIFSILCIGCVSTPDVSACGNEVYFSVNRMTRTIVRAERALRQGRLTTAIRLSLSSLSTMDEGEPGNPDTHEPHTSKRIQKKAKRLYKRVKRVAAIAIVRRDGRVSLRYKTAVRRIKPKKRLRNLKFALMILKKELEAKPKDPLVQSRFAEALGRFPKRREEGRKILKGLAAKDLLPDAWAYRALAEMNHLAGDTAGRDAAISQCETRAKRRKKSCRDFLKQSKKTKRRKRVG